MAVCSSEPTGLERALRGLTQYAKVVGLAVMMGLARRNQVAARPRNGQQGKRKAGPVVSKIMWLPQYVMIDEVLTITEIMTSFYHLRRKYKSFYEDCVRSHRIKSIKPTEAYIRCGLAYERTVIK